jgi:hypothetical protein
MGNWAWSILAFFVFALLTIAFPPLFFILLLLAGASWLWGNSKQKQQARQVHGPTEIDQARQRREARS